MKSLLAAFAACFLAVRGSAAVPLSVDAGVSYVLIDPAARPVPGAHYGGTEESDTLGAPYLRFSATPQPDWIVSVAYAYYRIRTSGAFSWDGPSVMQLAMRGWQTEDLHEVAVDARYSGRLSPNLHFEVGPVLACLWSRTATDIHAVSSSLPWLARIREDDTELELGGVAALRYALSDSMSVTFGYRYERAWGRDLHLFSGGMGFSF